MVKFTKRVVINRSQQDVFDYLSNPANIPEWRAGTVSAAWTPGGSPGVGSTYRQVSRIFGRDSESVFEMTAWDPPNQFGYKAVKIPFLVEHIEVLVTLAPSEEGTRLTFDGQIGMAGLFKLVEGRLGRQAEKADGIGIDRVKEKLEASR